MLRIGDQAPPFETVDHLGNRVSLRALLARGPVVLVFYPADFTPVCTREACMFRDAHNALQGYGASILGISADDSAQHRAFADQYTLPYPLISDSDRTLARQYRALYPFGLAPRRVTYVIDPEGRIRGAFHHELRAAKHVERARALLEQLADSP